MYYPEFVDIFSNFPIYGKAQMPQIETLDRGIVAVNMSKKEGQKKNGIFLSWRFLDSDDKTTAFQCVSRRKITYRNTSYNRNQLYRYRGYDIVGICHRNPCWW